MRGVFKKTYVIIMLSVAFILSGLQISDIQAASAGKVTLDQTSMVVGIGKRSTGKLKATITGSVKEVVFSTSNNKIATVNSLGVVTGVSVGTAKITCTIKGTDKKAVCKVTVRRYVEKLTIDDPYVNFYNAGETYQIKVSLTPNNATVKDLEYSIQDESVATVDSTGLVTSVGKGSTTITVKAKDGSKKNAFVRVKFVSGGFDAPIGFDARRNVAHGETKEITYYSSVTQSDRPALVYTPPGYTETKKYNVCYLLHGGGCDQNQWYSDGANNILDNLIADGKVPDMILVMPNCNTNTATAERGSNTASFQDDLITCLMPYIEKNYSVYTGRDHTALCGLSMGGGLTATIGFSRMDLFGYLAILSAAPSDMLTKFTSSLNDDMYTNYPPKVIWLSVGSADTVVGNSVENFKKELEKPEVQEYFKKNGTLYSYYYMPTTISHSYPEWNNGLYNFAQMIFK